MVMKVFNLDSNKEGEVKIKNKGYLVLKLWSPLCFGFCHIWSAQLM